MVNLPEQYEHSSAKYYIEGVQGIYAVTNFMELRDIDLTKYAYENRNVLATHKSMQRDIAGKKGCHGD